METVSNCRKNECSQLINRFDWKIEVKIEFHFLSEFVHLELHRFKIEKKARIY